MDYFSFYSDKRLLFRGPHDASFFGVDQIVTPLVEVEDFDINTINCTGSTPLMWAASNRHQGGAKILLGLDSVSPNKLDKRGQTLLHRAAVEGREGVAKILLERDGVDSTRLDKLGQTLLYRAAMEGHKGVVKVLLG